VEFKEGDIFRWSYNKDTDGLSYWARSRIAIFRNGRLRDTYWMHDLEALFSYSEGHSWSIDEAASDLDLLFVANISDLERQSYDKSELYDDADVVNLNHANSPTGNWYLRKGAQRSREKALATARYKRERSISEMVSAADDVRRMDRMISQIENGETLEGIWF
jgi:hypothetical protein